MMKRCQYVLLVETFVLALFFSSSAALFAEDVSISTYYPSPYGEYTTLRIQETSGALTDFTQGLAQAGLDIITGYPATHAYTPGIFWSTPNNNPSRPKAGIWMYEDVAAGSKLFFGTSNNYATGITNNGLVLDQAGRVGVGTSSPVALLDVNGVGAHGLGSVGAPSFTFRSDLTTGLWSSWTGPGTSALNFSTAGQERMRIDALGNVGIGTTAPNAKAILELNSTTQGFLPPGMTTAQRDGTAPPSSANGLVIYNTDNTAKRLNMYTYNSVTSTGSWVDVFGINPTTPVKAVAGSYIGAPGYSSSRDLTSNIMTIPCGFRPAKVDIILLDDGLGNAWKWEKSDTFPDLISIYIVHAIPPVSSGTTNISMTANGFTVAGCKDSVSHAELRTCPDYTGKKYYYCAYP